MRFLAWVLSLIFAFNLGADSAATKKETDDDLRNKVQDHIDVIVDEGAALVDDVIDEVRSDERVKDAEQAVKDAKEIVEETLGDAKQVVEDAQDRVEEKFGSGEKETEATPVPDSAEETPAPVEETSAPAPAEETPAPGEPING